NAPQEFVRRMVAEGRVQKNSSDRVWLCPSHPANQELEVESMLEIVRKYPVDGIHFDYIRYPDMSSCHCEGCRKRFGEKIGREFKNWPADLRDGGAVWDAWLEFRRSNIDAVVRRVSEGARQIRPDIQVSAAVFRNWSSDRDSVGQDWKMWCEKGWLDFVCPMNYVDSNAVFKNMILTQKDFAGKARLYPGIGLSCWRDSRDPVKLAEQIGITRELGLGGFTIFNFDANAETVLPFMRLGVTAEPGRFSGLWPFR
ncbi:MAG: family 10 glycosylhydrolase, partial [Kiritimatiellae bacterium]|nr:family 10 glycosylhydrolase [Kiritimatiellia bacterium]